MDVALYRIRGIDDMKYDHSGNSLNHVYDVD